MLLKSISSQFWALNGHHLGINRSNSVKIWHFRGVRQITEIYFHQELRSTPNGIRTRAATLKGWCPRPLDDGGLHYVSLGTAVVVGLPGFEPGTSASRTQRATKLRYSPQRVTPQPDNPTRQTQLHTKR